MHPVPLLLSAGALAMAATGDAPRPDRAVLRQAMEAGHPALARPDVPAPLFDPARDAAADVDRALARARDSGKAALIVMGGDWCHDSMALARLFASDRFRPMIAARYELVYVDVGHRDRNVDIARRFGLAGIDGTPTVVIAGGDGRARNLADAPTWRNAASRKPAAVYRHFERAAPPVVDMPGR